MSDWTLRCLLCERYRSDYLIAIQEHAMQEHGVTAEDLRFQVRDDVRHDEFGFFHHKYILPDGRPWLDAIEGLQRVARLRI